MFIYLASPYTILNADKLTSKQLAEAKENRFKEVCKTAASLMENGHQVFCPIAHSHPIEKYGMNTIKNAEFWLEQDYAILIGVDELWVLMLPGWDKSYGIKEEMQFCNDYEIPIRFLTPGEVLPEEIENESPQKAYA